MTLPDIWSLATIATKIALYLGILISSGTVFTSLVFSLKIYRSIPGSFAFLGLCAALLSFSLLSANLAGDATGLLDVELLQLLWSTQAGTTLVCQIMGMGILTVGLFMGPLGRWVSALGGLAYTNAALLCIQSSVLAESDRIDSSPGSGSVATLDGCEAPAGACP